MNRELGIDELNNVNGGDRSGADISMMQLQSLVSSRNTMLQLVTNMMGSINDGMKAVAGNVKG